MISAELSIIRSFLLPIIKEPFAHDRKWQVQGLGMLRTYIDPDTRLHIWDSRLNFCKDSGWHTHPWDFASFIAWGRIVNKCYWERAETELKYVRDLTEWLPFTKQHIICGPGGCAISEPVDVRLREAVNHTHYAGDHYQQRADEIHTTLPSDGTVTIITRKTVHQDGSANIYYPRGSTWSSAEARPALDHEIIQATSLALKKMENEIC